MAAPIVWLIIKAIKDSSKLCIRYFRTSEMFCKDVDLARTSVCHQLEYIAFQDNSDLKNHSVLTENDDPAGYITFEGTAAVPKNSEDQHFLSTNSFCYDMFLI